MAKVRGTKVYTARSSRISDWDIEREINQQTKFLANAGKTVVNVQMGQIQTTPSGDQTCLITLTWEGDDTDPKFIDTSKAGGCYVATAVYGSYDCPEVWTLRRYRDYSLSETWYGKMFIKIYYAISPSLVKWFGNTKLFNRIWKKRLDRMVDSLNKKGFENTPYNDK